MECHRDRAFRGLAYSTFLRDNKGNTFLIFILQWHFSFKILRGFPQNRDRAFRGLAYNTFLRDNKGNSYFAVAFLLQNPERIPPKQR
jgi:hypothetical protein